MNAVTQEMGECPCGEMRYIFGETHSVISCGVIGTKLQKNGHLVGCKCRECIGRRNRRSGQKTEAKRHRRLGGQGQTPRDELAFSYSINITTEDKSGKQIPATIRAFIESNWFRHTLQQAEKKVPVGSDALPMVVLDLGRKGMWMVGPLPERGLR